MRAEFIIKPTAHEQSCLLCKEEIKKGEKYLRMEQSTYPGYRVGAICKNHFKQGEL